MTGPDIAMTGFMLAVLAFLAVCAVASVREWRAEVRANRDYDAWRRAADIRRRGY